MSKRKKLAALLESAGIIAGSVAGWTMNATAGMAVLAFGLVAFGVAIERDA